MLTSQTLVELTDAVAELVELSAEECCELVGGTCTPCSFGCGCDSRPRLDLSSGDDWEARN